MMPRPSTGMPPTPASSTEIKGQDHSNRLSSLQTPFTLPPSAIGSSNATRSNTSESRMSPVSPLSRAAFPVQPSETAKSRRRSSAVHRETFTLPPPPTRSRKIIQMKPQAQDESPGTSGSLKTSGAGTTKNAGSVGSKKKQPSATTAAGRKQARKTAHSQIERRRRSKMNDEFGVLKELIPACKGEKQMHKLAILQASIEHVRYLEDCISKLKQHISDSSMPAPPEVDLPRPSNQDLYRNDEDEEEEEHDASGPEDVEMTGSEIAEAPEATSPAFPPAAPRSSQPPVSPAILPQSAQARQHSYSSTSTEYRHYSFSLSAGTSPAFGPQAHPHPTESASISHSTLTSPTLQPQRDIDREVSAALLMLNSDRRGTQIGGSSRGISVKDLLSS
ncbi:hypothetical protein F5Y15DRAFT_260607 [Xylariaceae sp. FL0016]|nr:hypothetical protein F5Y15DRAFT_260607 [Xylariaceae sp. FL0016]